MYSLRVISTPALGKAIDARTLLEEYVRMWQARGIRCGLAQSQFGKGLQLVAAFMFEKQADRHAFRDANRDNADFQLFLERMAGMLQEPPMYEFVEHLTPEPPAPASPPRYAQRITVTPLPGKQPEVRKLLEERIKLRLGQGRRATLAQIVSGGPQAYTVVLSFSSAGDLDALEEANRNDAAFAEFQQRLGPLLAAPPSFELLEILIPTQTVQAREPALATSRTS